MKRLGNVFCEITDYENLLTAHKNARKGKKNRKEVKAVEEKNRS
jgi:hypothetical protein